MISAVNMVSCVQLLCYQRIRRIAGLLHELS